MEWLPSIIGGGLLMVAVATLWRGGINATQSRDLSRLEHTEFKERVSNETIIFRTFILRELDNIERRLNNLEQTRPTTGELEARLGKQQRD